MRYQKSYDEAQNERFQQNTNAFNVAKLQARLEQVKAMGVAIELDNDVLYLTDKALNVKWEPWFKVYIRHAYHAVLSSPKVWNQILKS